MRNLKINKSNFFALNYLRKEEVVDKDGNKTGEYNIVYGNAIPMFAHISSAKGTAEVEIFGTDVGYDKTIILTNKEFKHLGFNENTVFFIDKRVEYKSNVPLYNYKIFRIAKTINEVVIAISQVRNNDNV